MTLLDLVAILLRRWYVLLAFIVMALAAFLALAADGGVYSTKPILSFSFPGSQAIAADSGLNDENVIAFAATVAEVVNNGRPIERYAAEDAPLYGAGAREEIRVGVPNVGGQWVTSFARAEIAISIVGRSEAWVHEQQARLVASVMEAAEKEQDARGVPETDRITPQVLPLSTRIELIDSSGAQKAMAMSALLLAALITGAWACVLLDRLLNGRRMRMHLRLPVGGRVQEGGVPDGSV